MLRRNRGKASGCCGTIGTAELVRMQIALQASMDNIRQDLLHLNRASLSRLYEYHGPQIEDEHVRLLIAEVAGCSQVVGMGGGRIGLHPNCVPMQSRGLTDWWIDPAHRRRGLARRIIDRLPQFFKDNCISPRARAPFHASSLPLR